MKAITIKDFGSGDNLSPQDIPVPVIQEGEVLIKVCAAGINRADLLQRKGHYPPPEGASPILGLEVSGTIEDTNSPLWQKGDEVCALLEGGGYAEYSAVRATQCLPRPKNIPLADAAALPEALFTVWKNVFRIGALTSGETILIHGGTSGIGTTAIQMAKAFGANVIVTCGSDEKCSAAENIGADVSINYKQQDFAKIIGKNAVDLVLDMVGGDYIEKNISTLKKGGRHVSIAFMQGKTAQINMLPVLQKNLTITGSTLRNAPADEKEALCADIRKYILPLIEKGEIKPVIHDRFAAEDVTKAHDVMQSSTHIGKLILRFD